jgi:D-aminoacyl-tRNA deacylase
VRALVQRVSSAAVEVDGEEVAAIGPGLLVLLGVRVGDGEPEADRIAGKIERLRVFEDARGKMNLSVREVGGELLCVSQFTLYGDTRKGNRPSFVEAAPPELAEPLYERVRAALGAEGGAFGAHMRVSLVNDGPVTVLLE